MIERQRNGYRIIYLQAVEHSHASQRFRLQSGPADYFEGDLSNDWLDAFEEAGKTEPRYPFQTRDESMLRLYGA